MYHVGSSDINWKFGKIWKNLEILSIPYSLSDTFGLIDQEGAAEALSQFYYPPVCACTISYPLSALREDRLTDGKLFGFGQLHPRSQGVQTLGMLPLTKATPDNSFISELLCGHHQIESFHPLYHWPFVLLFYQVPSTAPHCSQTERPRNVCYSWTTLVVLNSHKSLRR